MDGHITDGNFFIMRGRNETLLLIAFSLEEKGTD